MLALGATTGTQWADIIHLLGAQPVVQWFFRRTNLRYAMQRRPKRPPIVLEALAASRGAA